ncbi:hypothetical protein CRE_03658 [Caenorhabditis remanei]|uniref:Uncharacterized protein n=1 Tax=Caenorhabditis remanei TaxID=31234 RepID=E3LXI1_CAERE|nr:hypothetical protein CRE_03658 [Caenorhabditis remanei]
MLQYAGYQPQKNYNFNFEKFFSQFPGFNAPQRSPPSTFSSNPSMPSSSSSRIFNVYGQDAEAFGSAIGKSIGERIQQAFSQQDPTYDIQFTPPSSPTSSSSATSSASSYASMSPSTSSSSSYPSSYGSSIPSSPYPTSPSTYQPTSSWPSTHPPEDLPTVQQAFQAQQQSYGSTPSIPQSLVSNSNGFGGLPGLLPPPNNKNQNSDCPWCSQSGGYRGKRIPSGEEKKKDEKL